MHIIKKEVASTGDIQILGDLDINKNIGYRESFNEDVIESLSSLSKIIFKRIQRKTLSKEYLYVAHWLRKRNILKTKEKYSSNEYLSVGRGLALHITPSNVRANALFSLAFGLLSGNSNYVRISRRQLLESQDLFNALAEWLEQYPKISNLIKVGYYPHDSELGEILNKKASVRIIWGGDQTITKMKEMQTSPMCIDICFPNRVSYGLIEMKTLGAIDANEIKGIANQLSRDIYMFDQMACSSPTTIFVLDERKIITKEIIDFLELLNHQIGINNENEEQGIAHLRAKTKACLTKNNKIIFSGKYLLAMEVKGRDSILEVDLCNNGIIGIITVSSINEVKDYILQNAQTMVDISGNLIKSEAGKDLLVTTPLTRIVKPGNALTLDGIWDGHDIIKSSTKTVPMPRND